MQLKIGKIVSTHGIKGEIKISSSLNEQEKKYIYKKGTTIYIGEKNQKEIIKSYRPHKNYDMITLEGYEDIDSVLPFMKQNVYVKKEELSLETPIVFEEELIGYQVITETTLIGTLVDIYNTGGSNKVMEIQREMKKVLIPYRKEFIKAINTKEKTIVIIPCEGMID